ncbi:MAG: hypothetical protein ABIV48_09425 [Pyrinomonadaceae bacterium]
MNNSIQNICPRCDSLRVKTWDELTDEEEMLAERLPTSAEFTPQERKKHRFCTRCWLEESEDIMTFG